MKRYLIERDIPSVGRLTRTQLKDLAATEHSRLAGFPITKITEVPTVIDPMTGFSHILDSEKAA